MQELTLRQYVIDAFTDRVFAGNPAAICVLERWLPDSLMQDIAKEIDRENQIITDLLSLVKMDRSGQTMNIQTMNINDLLEQILKRLKPIAEKKNVEMILGRDKAQEQERSKKRTGELE